MIPKRYRSEINKMFKSIDYVKRIKDKKEFYIGVRDLIREFKRIVIIEYEKSSLFDEKMNRLEKNKHQFYFKTYELYTKLIGEVHNYKEKKGNEVSLVESFDALENDITKKIKQLEWIEFIFGFLMMVVIILLLDKAISYNILIIEFFTEIKDLLSAITFEITFTLLILLVTAILTYWNLMEKISNKRESKTNRKTENVYSPLMILSQKYIKILHEFEWSKERYFIHFVEFIHQYSIIEEKYSDIFIHDQNLMQVKKTLLNTYNTFNPHTSDFFVNEKPKRDKIDSILKDLYSHSSNVMFNNIDGEEGNDFMKDLNSDSL